MQWLLQMPTRWSHCTSPLIFGSAKWVYSLSIFVPLISLLLISHLLLWYENSNSYTLFQIYVQIINLLHHTITLYLNIKNLSVTLASCHSHTSSYSHFVGSFSVCDSFLSFLLYINYRMTWAPSWDFYSEILYFLIIIFSFPTVPSSSAVILSSILPAD